MTKAGFALLGLLLLASGARADARISALDVAVDGNRVLASFTLSRAFDHRLSRRLDSGLPTSILYEVELYKDRKNWFDNRLDAATLEVVALYDAVARTYTVHFRLNDQLVESRTVHDREALEAAMTRIERLPAFTLGPEAGGRLLVRVRAELGSRTLLSIIPVAIHTDWKESRKFRAPAHP